MNLRKKKLLAQRTLKAGKKRIIFVKERMDEIKEAITKQDILGLKESEAIIIKEVKGRKKKIKRKVKRSAGNIRKKINQRKRDYVLLTRKLRRLVLESKKQGLLNREEILEIRKKIRNRFFRSKEHLKEYIKKLGK